MAAEAPPPAAASAAAAAPSAAAAAAGAPDAKCPATRSGQGNNYQEVLAVYARGLFTGGDLRQPVRMHLTTHPLAHTPLPARLHEVAPLRVTFAGIPLDDLTPVRGHALTPERMRAMLLDYEAVPPAYITRMRRALLDTECLLNGFRGLLATLVLGATPVLPTRYNPAFYTQRTAWLADAMRMQLWVGVSIATGRVAQRRLSASESLPRYMLWCRHSSEHFGETLKSRREEATQKARDAGRVRLDEIVSELVGGAAGAAGAGAGAAPAAAAAPAPRTLTELGSAVEAALCGAHDTHDASVSAVRVICCQFARRAMQRAFHAPSDGIGVAVRESLAAFLLALYAEAPQLCPNYPLHVPAAGDNNSREPDGSIKTADPNSKRETKRTHRLVHKEFRGARQWYPWTQFRASAAALVANALALVRTKMSDTQRNTAQVLATACATVHAYRREDLPRIPFDAHTQRPLYDHSQTLSFERPPKPTPTPERAGAKLRLPIFFSMASLCGTVEFLCRRHAPAFTRSVSDTSVFLLTRPRVENRPALKETVLCGTSDYVAARATVDVGNRVELATVLEADWLVCLGWARHNLYSRSTQRNDRELALEIKTNAALTTPMDLPPAAAAAAVGAAAFGVEGIDLKQSEYRPSARVLCGRGLEQSMRAMLFHPDAHLDSRALRGGAGADPRAMRLAELMAGRECASDTAPACPILGRLATELHEYVLAWLHISPPELPMRLFAVIANATCELDNWPALPRVKPRDSDADARNSPRVAMCALLNSAGVGLPRRGPLTAWWNGLLRRESLAVSTRGGQSILVLVDASCAHPTALAYAIDQQRDARLVPPLLALPVAPPPRLPLPLSAIGEIFHRHGHGVAFAHFAAIRSGRRDAPSTERLLAEYEIALRSTAAPLRRGGSKPICCYAVSDLGDQMAFLASCLRTSAAHAADAALSALLSSGVHDLLLMARELEGSLDLRTQRALGLFLKLAQLASPRAEQRARDSLDLLRLCLLPHIARESL